MEHLFSQLRLCGVNAYIDRRHTHFYKSVYIIIAHICKRYIITLQERKAHIIILKIDSFTHTLRELVYKAEYALVRTAPVSYTHLDVYKRQIQGRDILAVPARSFTDYLIYLRFLFLRQRRLYRIFQTYNRHPAL